MAKKHKLQVKTHYSSLYTQFNHYYLVMSLQSTFWLYLLYKNIRAQYIKQTQISKSNQGFREHHKTQKVSKCSTNLNRRFDQGRLAPLSLWVIARWRVRKAPRHRNQKIFVRVYMYIYICSADLRKKFFRLEGKTCSSIEEKVGPRFEED